MIGAVDEMNIESRATGERRLRDIRGVASREEKLGESLPKRAEQIGVARVYEQALNLRYVFLA